MDVTKPYKSIGFESWFGVCREHPTEPLIMCGRRAPVLRLAMFVTVGSHFALVLAVSS